MAARLLTRWAVKNREIIRSETPYSMDNMNAKLTAETHTIKFPRGGKNGTTAQIHVNGCNALNIGNAFKFVKFAYDAAEVTDLEERGFKVKVCDCCK